MCPESGTTVAIQEERVKEVSVNSTETIVQMHIRWFNTMSLHIGSRLIKSSLPNQDCLENKIWLMLRVESRWQIYKGRKNAYAGKHSFVFVFVCCCGF